MNRNHSFYFVTDVFREADLIFHVFGAILPTKGTMAHAINHVTDVANEMCSLVTCAIECASTAGCGAFQLRSTSKLCACAMYEVDYSSVTSISPETMFHQEPYTCARPEYHGHKVI